MRLAAIFLIDTISALRGGRVGGGGDVLSIILISFIFLDIFLVTNLGPGLRNADRVLNLSSMGSEPSL